MWASMSFKVANHEERIKANEISIVKLNDAQSTLDRALAVLTQTVNDSMKYKQQNNYYNGDTSK